MSKKALRSVASRARSPNMKAGSMRSSNSRFASPVSVYICLTMFRYAACSGAFAICS